MPEIHSYLQRIDGRRIKIARSRRVQESAPSSPDSNTSNQDFMQFDEEDEYYFDALVGSGDHEEPSSSISNPLSAYAKLRKDAQDELEKLEEEFKSHFDSTNKALERLKTKRHAKRLDKLRIERELIELQSILTSTEAEIASIDAEINSKEDVFNVFVQGNHYYLF